MSEQTICSKCGFVKEAPREPVFITNNILSFLEYEHNTCEECGHQKDGMTIPIVHRRMQQISNTLITEREALWSFVKEFYALDQDQKKEVCVEVPRFCKPGYESPADDMYAGDMPEPYSWNVVWIEIVNGTPFARTLVREWRRERKRCNDGKKIFSK